MKPWTVEIPPLVEDLITTQVLFIAEDSVDNALAWEARLDEPSGVIRVIGFRHGARLPGRGEP